MLKKGFIAFCYITGFFIFWTCYTVATGFKSNNLDNLDINIFLGVPAIVSSLIILFIFWPRYNKLTLKDTDPGLVKIINDILNNYLLSREKGEIINNKYISPKLLPEMQKEISAYKDFLSKGVITESKAKDINNLEYTILKNTDKCIKVKISGLFKHQYFSNGKPLETPVDPNSYLPENEIAEYENAEYIFNFETPNNGEYYLVGYTDNIMGNKYGDI